MEKIYKGEIQRLFPILEAIKEGKTIQWLDMGLWRDIDGDDDGFFLDTLIGKLMVTESSQSQSTALLPTQKSAGLKCRNTSRLGGLKQMRGTNKFGM